ncbi:MAG: HAD-IB family hydrolase [Ndongobacter sp.]|nr:HAD-IB family hydrolase [Ndongobacter sp.]
MSGGTVFPSRIGAFFDIDGTLARESMLIHHFKQLIRYRIIDEGEWINRIRPRYLQYDKRYAEYDEYLDQVTAVYKEWLNGLNRAVIDFSAQQVVSEYGDVVYKFTRERIAWHQAQGHAVFFISGSPDFLISKMAERYGVTDYRATAYLTDENDCFTSEVIPMWDSVSKSHVVHEFLEKYDLDAEKSYSYGDTNGDFSMLKLLGRPTAINPSYRLLKMIQNDAQLAQRARIVLERKDVIYRLDASVLATPSLEAGMTDFADEP